MKYFKLKATEKNRLKAINDILKNAKKYKHQANIHLPFIQEDEICCTDGFELVSIKENLSGLEVSNTSVFQNIDSVYGNFGDYYEFEFDYENAEKPLKQIKL